MKNELTALEALRTTIINGLNAYLPSGSLFAAISADNVEIAFPVTEQMKENVMFYLFPDYADYQSLATTSDSVEFRIKVFLLVKRDTHSNLTEKYFGYQTALFELLRTETSLGGVVDFTDINDTEFYPAVDYNPNIQGAEISVSVRYTKDF